MIYELNHVGVFVRDLAAALRFWSGALGAPIVWRNVIEATSTDVMYLKVGGGLVELLHPREPDPEQQWGLDHVAFLTDDLDSDFDRIVESGCAGLVTPRVAGTGVGRLAFVEAPDGMRVELLQRDLQLRGELVRDAVVQTIDSVDVAATDVAATAWFFGDVIGMDIRPPQESTVVAAHGADTVAIRPAGPDAVSGLVSLTVRVADVAGVRDRASGASTPGASVQDPDGVVVELVQA